MFNQGSHSTFHDIYSIQGNSPKPSQAAISLNAWQAMLASCQAAYPQEACGVLACSLELQSSCQNQNNMIIVDQIYPITNIAEQAASNFQFDPNEWISALFSIQNNRQSLVGIYHSHPRSNPVPSMVDLAGVQYLSAVSYWIISFEQSHTPSVQPYWYDKESFTPLMLAKIGI